MNIVQQLKSVILFNRKKVDKHIENLRFVMRMTRDSKDEPTLKSNIVLSTVSAISCDVLDDVLRHIAAGHIKEDPFEMFKEALNRVEATDKLNKLHQL